MAECRYCGEAFDTEDALLEHFAGDHGGELGRIDRRRVEAVASDRDGDVGLPVIIAGGVGVLVLVGILAAVFVMGGGDDVVAGQTPTGLWTVHEHGTMEVVIDGEPLDLSEPRFLERDDAFHFHGGYYDAYGAHIWHKHAQGVTLQYALGTLGIEVNEAGTVLEFDGTRYDDTDPDTSIEITVNGEPVEPGTYAIQGVGPEPEAAAGAGDDIRVVIETGD